MNSIFHRTSVRSYTDKTVEQEKIEKILKAGMAAPSAMNQQPWEFYVVQNKEILEKLSKCSIYAGSVAKSSVTFVVCYRNDSLRAEYREIDCSACTENMLLEIDNLGLGGVWIGIAPDKERMSNVSNAVDLPENLSAFALIACGYPESIRDQENRFDENRVHYIK